ncbi:MAG: lytic transglycosylase domain-containing protein [Pseudolabrys sp.]
MRHLFVPACLCLATFSGSLGSDPTPSLADFSRTPIVKEDIAPGDSGESGYSKDTPRDAVELSMFSAERSATDFDGQAGLASPPLPPVPKPVVDRSRAEICDTLTQAAQLNDVPVPFFIRLLFQESGFKPDVVSSAGAEGIAQFMPQTSSDIGLDNPFDPLPAIRASARLLRGLMQQFGNLGLAAAAYNAGPKRVEDWLAKKGKLPRETQGYVKSVTGREAEKWTVAEAGSPAVKIPRRAPCQEAAGLLAWNGPERIPMPPARTTPIKTRIATRAHVKVVSRAGATKPAKRPTAVKTSVPTIHLAATHRQKRRKLQLSQR